MRTYSLSALIVFVLSIHAFADCKPGDFASAGTNFPVGDWPYEAVSADFNQDSHLDVAVIGGGMISVLIGHGDGIFDPAVNLPAPSNSNAIVGADFDSSGSIDLAVVGTSGTLAVYLGAGNGSFAIPLNSNPGGDLNAITSGDFNLDNHPDLALSAYQGTVLVLMGLGDGTFGSAVPYSVFGSDQFYVTAARLNGDAYDDLIVATGVTAKVSVLLNNGNGTFASPVNYDSAGGASFIAVGALNADSLPDLAVANTAAGSVSVFYGQSNGTLSNAVFYDIGSEVWGTAIEDFNEDGYPDIAISGGRVLFGNSGGTFTLQSSAGFDRTSRLIPGDWKEDAHQDLLVMNQGSVSLLPGNGNGTFGAIVRTLAGNNPWSSAAGDFNEDGNADVVVSDFSANLVEILTGKGDGTFNAPTSYSICGGQAVSVTVTDLNADGHSDLAVACQSVTSISVLLGDGTGNFSTSTVVAPGWGGVSAVAAGDFNEDGKQDLTVINTGSSSIKALLNQGDGTFVSSYSGSVSASSYSDFISVSDVNNDTHVDLIVSGIGFKVFLGDGSGSFTPAGSLSSFAGSLTAADFNGDQFLDLAFAATRFLWFYPGLGNGTFGTFQSFQTDYDSSAAVTADLNGDGLADVATRNDDSSSVSVLLSHGDGTFAGGIHLLTGSKVSSLTPVDLNNDGRTDLVTTNVNPDSVTSLLNTCGNDVPRAKADSFAGNVNHTLYVPAPGVLANDIDTDAITASVVAGPSHGVLNLDANGSFSYVPDLDFTGNDTFSYQAADSLVSSKPAVVTITVDSSVCLFCDSFDDNVLDAQWTYVKVEAINESGGAVNILPVKGKPQAIAMPVFGGCLNCTQRTAVRFGPEANGVAWLYGWYQDKQNTIEVLMKNKNDKIILRQRAGNKIVSKVSVPFVLQPLTEYTVELGYDGAVITLIIDGGPVLNLTPVQPVAGTVGFAAKGGGISFDFVEVM